MPRSASTDSRLGSSQLNSTSYRTHDCIYNQEGNHPPWGGSIFKRKGWRLRGPTVTAALYLDTRISARRDLPPDIRSENAGVCIVPRLQMLQSLVLLAAPLTSAIRLDAQSRPLPICPADIRPRGDGGNGEAFPRCTEGRRRPGGHRTSFLLYALSA
jgi:hypothetical protein